MHEQSASLLAWLVVILLSHFATGHLVRFLPWSEAARKSNMPLFFGAALAPFLLGFIVIFALKLLPEQSHLAHSAFIFMSLLCCILLSYLTSFYIKPPSFSASSFSSHRYFGDEKLSIVLLAGFIIFLIASALKTPLMQTDALEYAQMGRIVFDTNTLASYPPVVASNHPSGFYAPVTHPPLYVALVYASYLLQDNADMPFLMRLISPWCLLVATGVVFSFGSMINRRTGLFAAVLFISTPLLFMGATASLIDPLSVLGFTLVFASIFSFSASPIRLGLLQGGVLGIAFWVHSQAVLFPVLLIAGLVFYNGVGKWPRLAKQILAIIPISIAIGIAPYLNNYKKIGSFITDNPLVFQLQNLAWKDYFLIGRGVDSLTAQIQYGVFKGWFALEAYGLLFWLMTAGFLWLKRPSLYSIRQFVIGNNDSPKKILWASLAVVLLYHFGVVLAIALGVNQMFRIERYMLILLPCVAVLSGFVLSNCFDLRGKTRLRRTFAGIVMVLLLLQIGVFYLQQESRSEPPQQRVMEFIKENLPEDSIVYATLSGDMYYSNRKMLGNLAPSLLEFYQAKTPEQGVELLKKLGVTHIYVTANAQPTFYNSSMQSIVGESRFSTLIYSADGHQLYAINARILPIKSPNNFDFMPPNAGWERRQMLLIGGRKALAGVGLFAETMSSEIKSETKLPFSLFQRDISVLLQTKPIIAHEASEYQIQLDIEGYGLVRFWLTQYDEQGHIVEEKYLLTETILSERYSERNFVYRFKTSPKAKFVQFGIEHYGNSRVRVKRALLKLP
ncbi:MAG: hypothetical protein EBR02_00190 [Alphaproteobacteria bacterium]|nr:hypothetical protein [Alphaproteobacteria bacterium]